MSRGDRPERPGRRPTQREIARRLGLSPATVSLALRDNPMISAETRRLVREAIAEAGYVRNVSAAALRTGRSRIVGVSFHNIAHQFFAEMLIAIEETLGAAGLSVFINNHGEQAPSLARFVETLSAHGAEGLLVSPPPHVGPEILAPIAERGTPVVYVSRRIREDERADWVVNADRTAMARAAGRLLSLGHRHIALVGGQPGNTVAEERVAGFREALEGAGIGWDARLWRQCRPRLIEGGAATRALLAEAPRVTGLVAFNDLVAFGAMNAARSMGVEPGRDLGVVALGGTEEAAAYHPALTTVLDNPAKIGRLAAEMLLQRLEEPGAPPRRIALDPKLVIRASCGAPPG
ncbi:LacI family DNA-binding transcriptional regulator [Paralimibaculum aggregatum]|uniref:LacI family DNA-binding transcriptional regulator n=1 Tax=Paralimibaculum aggregatum TaxID=3036245 RepID=A0ABQ6LNQ1_9RHOB|nr:LacI family DNA-binding transcriptional regulator [Limibaculum sp. NKW23]GMG84627.1 LacI family DNA-binding transcriptional regulator [Limibaculum sp. NKW23]